jgi:DNA-binding IclR family transcriptional regulator
MPYTERDSKYGTHSESERPRASEGGHRAANRIVDILELLARSADGLALHDVSAQLEAPKSSLLPLLRALTARGFLAQGRSGEYRLGAGALDLASSAPAHRELVQVARPALMDLSRRTGETVFLATLSSDRTSIVYVDKLESDHIIRYAGGVGDRRPLHATSSGKAIMAFLPEEEREDILGSLPLDRHTERTVTSQAALRASLADVRRKCLRHRRGVVPARRASRRRSSTAMVAWPGPARRRPSGRAPGSERSPPRCGPRRVLSAQLGHRAPEKARSMEFGILFTSHPNHATEPYRIAPCTRVTADQAADAPTRHRRVADITSRTVRVMPDVFLSRLLAARTSRIRLGTAVVTVPLYDPVRVVENVAFVDNLSNGRVVLGHGSGYRPYEFEGFGRDFDNRRDVQEEAIGLILALLHGRRTAHKGTYFRSSIEAPYEIFPVSVQEPHPPLFMAAGTERSMPTRSPRLRPHAVDAPVLRDARASVAFYRGGAPGRRRTGRNPAHGKVDVARWVYVAGRTPGPARQR